MPENEDQNGQGQGDNSNTELAAAKAELAREKQQYRLLQAELTRKSQEAAELKRMQTARFSETDRSNDYQEQPDKASQVEQQFQSYRQTMDVRLFKIENPDAAKDWGSIMDIINDPEQGPQVATFDQASQPDYYRTFQNADRLRRLRKLEQAEKEAADARAKNNQDRNRQIGAATISGVGASEGGEEIDIDNMEPEEMVKRGLVKTDPLDPPRFGRLPTMRRT